MAKGHGRQVVFRRYLQTRSPGPGQCTRAFAHSQPVHDCRLLPLSDYLSIVLCFNRGRSRDFRFLTQIRRFASVCLARNIRISVGWIPSEFNSSDKGSREHGNVYDSSKSVVHNLHSSEKQTFPASRTWFHPTSANAGRPHNLAKWLPGMTSCLKSSMALRKKRETLRKRFLTRMESKDGKKYNPHTSMEADKQVPPRVVFDAFGQSDSRWRRAAGTSAPATRRR